MPAQVAKMTWKQVRDILFHPCDGNGSLEVEYNGEAVNELDEMRQQWKDQGMNDREVEVKLHEFQEMLYAEKVCNDKRFDEAETKRQLAIFKAKLIQQRAGKGMSIRS